MKARRPASAALALAIAGLALFAGASCRRGSVIGRARPATSAAAWALAPTSSAAAPAGSGAPLASASIADFPAAAPRPTPTSSTFHGCPPTGRGGDGALHLLENRNDESAFSATRLEAVLALPWPKSVEGRERKAWSAADAAEIARFEGAPVSIEGFVAAARLAPPEAQNCHANEPELRDLEIWLAPQPGDDRTRAVVARVTPRARARRPAITLDAFKRAAEARTRVRLSGWVLFDADPRAEVGKTRGTLFELRPALRVEIERDGRFLPLEGKGDAP